MLTPRDHLMTRDQEFQKLAQEHTQYSSRLDSLTQKRYLSEDEKLEEVRLKKLKLRLKDQMEAIERQFRQQAASLGHGGANSGMSDARRIGPLAASLHVGELVAQGGDVALREFDDRCCTRRLASVLGDAYA